MKNPCFYDKKLRFALFASLRSATRFLNQKIRKKEWLVRWTPAQTSWVNSLFYWNLGWVSPNCPRNAYVSDAPFCGAHLSFNFRRKNGRTTCLIIYGISQLELFRFYHEKSIFLMMIEISFWIMVNFQQFLTKSRKFKKSRVLSNFQKF